MFYSNHRPQNGINLLYCCTGQDSSQQITIMGNGIQSQPATGASLAQKLNDASIDRVMAIDKNWNIIAWNRTSESITGITAASLLGKNILDSFPAIMNDPEMLQAITHAFEGKKAFLSSNYSSFNRHYYENHYIPLKDDSGEVTGVLNIMHDVAHRIKVEKQLQKLNMALERKFDQLEKANKELAAFTYITGRDIKEPLKHVYTSLEMLARKEGLVLSNASRGNLRRMQSSLNRMNLLLDDIVAVSGTGVGDQSPETVDLNEVLNEAKSNLRGKITEKKAIIQSSLLPTIPGYRDLLIYLFQHLLDNAIKFQSEINVPIVTVSSDVVTITSLEGTKFQDQKSYVKINFEDNGIGLRAEDSERIFNMFEKLHDRQYAGSGTGLTISKKIVEKHEGTIEVQSEPDQGSVFSCLLPLQEEN